MASDSELIQAVLRREEHAFIVLVQRHEKGLRCHLLRIVRDEASTEDLLQEVLLRLWERAGQYSGRGTVEAWLMRIATNLAINHLRSLRRRRGQPLEPPGPSSGGEQDDLVPGWMVDDAALGPDSLAQQAEEHEILHRLVDGLSEEKREIVRMVHDDQMGHTEAAEALGIPLGTAKSRLHYALQQLQRQWKAIDRQETP